MSNKYEYMGQVANFSLLGATGSALGGGLLYGGGYALSKKITSPKNITPEQARDEVLANGVGGALSGAGLYAASKLAKLKK
jgi:hypothetical protein